MSLALASVAAASHAVAAGEPVGRALRRGARRFGAHRAADLALGVCRSVRTRT